MYGSCEDAQTAGQPGQIKPQPSDNGQCLTTPDISKTQTRRTPENSLEGENPTGGLSTVAIWLKHDEISDILR